MKSISKFLLLMLIVPAFSACIHIDDDGDDYDQYEVDIATVINPTNVPGFTFQLDNNKLLKVTQTGDINFIPKDGQRIIAYYTPLYTSEKGYDYAAKLWDAYNVLTKGIFNITPATQDSIGNDSVYIDDMWIGSNYLNVQFVYPGYDKVHYINLVSDTTKKYTDGKIHLEFRHNANGDKAAEYKRGIVSFKLTSLVQSDALANSVLIPFKLVIHVNIANQTAEKTYEFTYTPGSIQTAGRQSLAKNLSAKIE